MSLYSKITLLFLVFVYTHASAQYSNEILKLARVDQLALYDDDAAVKQLSSYDRTGGNDDGFSGKYSYLRKENGNLVIADLKGSGVIQRIWTPTPTSDTIQFYFDGETTPRISCKFIDLFSGKNYPFERPVVGNEVGGYYCYLPIPYKKSCKIVFKGERMMFFQIQYRELKEGVEVETFPEKLSPGDEKALEEVVSFWKKSGSCILPEIPGLKSAIEEETKNITIKPGEKIQVFELTNGGRICGLEIIPKVGLNTDYKDLIFRARWDDEQVTAINCPLIDFFGYAFGKPSMQSLLAGVNGNKHYCYFPMPFDKHAVLELEYLKHDKNLHDQLPLEIKVFYSSEKRLKSEGKFYASWRHELNPPLGQSYQILKKEGKGHYVGTLLQAQGRNSGMTIFFEGDDECYVDGELQLHGTGSEDYFNGGWYALADRWDQAFSLPLHGCLDYSIPMARTGGYRLLVSDKIPFNREILQTIEHGPENNNIPVNYASVAFYYCDRPPLENKTPESELLAKIESPDLLEYWLQLLPVKALSHGSSISYKNEKTPDGKSFGVMELKVNGHGFAKFELDVPSEGEYELYLSYLKGPQSGNFDVSQRQIPIKTNVSEYSEETTFIEKELIGTLNIKKGTNTITIFTKAKAGADQRTNFLLHRVYLKRMK
ncbi:glycoside hydrolase family 172 protein [Sunxiuqinia sp. A32]|uniref:glycoside hydrolase family 172 protein n=1 Tax=Sunxiuqinia sp. A32 TaxID=3461496 RepID=UPI004045786F